MRAGIGFVALLLGVGLLVTLFAWNANNMVGRGSPGRQATGMAADIGLQTTEGTHYSDTIRMEPEYRDGKLLALKVADIDAAGPMAMKMGLKKNDRILEVANQAGLQKVREFNDDEIAKNTVIEAPRGHFSVVVQRGSQLLTLPAGTAAAAATPAPAAASSDDTGLGAAPAAPTPAAPAVAAPAGDDTGLGAAPTTQPAETAAAQPKPKKQQGPKGFYGHALDLRDKISSGQAGQEQPDQ